MVQNIETLDDQMLFTWLSSNLSAVIKMCYSVGTSKYNHTISHKTLSKQNTTPLIFNNEFILQNSPETDWVKAKGTPMVYT